MTDFESSFLNAGLRHFPDAHATVSAFRRLVTEKVDEILSSSRPDVWKPKDVKGTRGESNGLWVGAGGPMALELVAGKALVIDVGISWNSSHFKEPVAIVAVVYSATAVIGRRLEERGDDGIRVVRNGNRDFFITAVGSDAKAVEDAFRRVVEAAASAVAAASSVNASGPIIPPADR